MEQDLQHAHRLAGDLCAGHALEEGLAHFVGDLRLGELALVLADGADLRNGVDAGRHVIDEAPAVVLHRAASSRTALVGGGAGQARPADHITSGEDVADFGAVVLVDVDLATAVDLDADVLQAELVGVAGTAVAPQQAVGLDLLAGLEVQDHPVLQALDALVLLVVTDQHVVVAQVIAQGVGNLVVEEAEQLVAVVDQIHQHAQAAEDGGVFGPDHTGSVDDDPARRVGQTEDGVTVVDARVVEVDISRTVGTRTGGDDDLLGHQLFHHATGADHFHGLLVGEAGGAEKHVDAIACVEAGTRGHLLGDHPLGALQHVGEGEPARLADLAEQRVGVVLHDLPHRVAQGLGRNGAEVGAVAADQRTVVHHRHLATGLGGVHRRALARRAGTQHHYVVVVDSHAYSS
ncbi:hypothetical protein D9M69_322290 [compost metagenome]